MKIDRLRNLDKLPPGAPLSIPETSYLLGVSRSTLWRRVRDGSLPKPERVLGRLAFRVGDVRRVIG